LKQNSNNFIEQTQKWLSWKRATNRSFVEHQLFPKKGKQKQLSNYISRSFEVHSKYRTKYSRSIKTNRTIIISIGYKLYTMARV